MAEYKVIHKEELVGWFYVTADNEQDAIDKWQQMVSNGEVDFSDMELVDSYDEAERLNDI